MLHAIEPAATATTTQVHATDPAPVAGEGSHESRPVDCVFWLLALLDVAVPHPSGLLAPVFSSSWQGACVAVLVEAFVP